MKCREIKKEIHREINLSHNNRQAGGKKDEREDWRQEHAT